MCIRDSSVYVAYPLITSGNSAVEEAIRGREVYVVVWTTTPWTLPASLAVAIHPDFDYAFVPARDGKVFIIAKALKGKVASVTGLELGEPLLTVKGRDLAKARALHPFYDDREMIFALAEYVGLDQGTGCVHTAPGHGAEDFETGIRYGLDILNPVDDKGYFLPGTKLVGGLSLEEGSKKVLAVLRERGRLLGSGRITHSYPHCWRCKKPVIFRATEQWFVAVNAFKENALDQIDRVRWIPEWGKERICLLYTSPCPFSTSTPRGSGFCWLSSKGRFTLPLSFSWSTCSTPFQGKHAETRSPGTIMSWAASPLTWSSTM